MTLETEHQASFGFRVERHTLKHSARNCLRCRLGCHDDWAADNKHRDTETTLDTAAMDKQGHDRRDMLRLVFIGFEQPGRCADL